MNAANLVSSSKLHGGHVGTTDNRGLKNTKLEWLIVT